jgi:hypothetical protein
MGINGKCSRKYEVTINKRPMGHIAHLRNLGPYKSIFQISNMHSLKLPHPTLGSHDFKQLAFVDVRKLSCKIQLF